MYFSLEHMGKKEEKTTFRFFFIGDFSKVISIWKENDMESRRCHLYLALINLFFLKKKIIVYDDNQCW